MQLGHPVEVREEAQVADRATGLGARSHGIVARVDVEARRHADAPIRRRLQPFHRHRFDPGDAGVVDEREGNDPNAAGRQRLGHVAGAQVRHGQSVRLGGAVGRSRRSERRTPSETRTRYRTRRSNARPGRGWATARPGPLVLAAQRGEGVGGQLLLRPPVGLAQGDVLVEMDDRAASGVVHRAPLAHGRLTGADELAVLHGRS